MTSGIPTSEMYGADEFSGVGSLGMGMGRQARHRGTVVYAKDELSGMDSPYQNYLPFGDDDLVDSLTRVPPMHLGLSELYGADEIGGVDGLNLSYLLFDSDDLADSLTRVSSTRLSLSEMYSALSGVLDAAMVRRGYLLTGVPLDPDVAQILRRGIVSRDMRKGEPIQIWLGSLEKGWGANPVEYLASPSCSRAVSQQGGESGQLPSEVAARLRDIFTLAAEDPDEPNVSPASVRNLVAFLVDNPALPHPSIGLDPNGYVDAEWSLPDGTLVVMVFLPEDQIRCVAVGSVDVSGTLPRQDVLALLEPLPLMTA